MSLSLPKMKTATRRRAGLAPGRGMPQSYVETELNAPRQIVYNLIRGGADVNDSDADGRTPLMMAAMQGWEGAVRELLAANACSKCARSRWPSGD